MTSTTFNSEMTQYLPTVFSQYIYLSRYSRWLWSENRRETWPETVKRYFDFFQEHLLTNHNHDITDYRAELEDAVLNLKVVPSMRAVMTAGDALKRDNIAAYNCLAYETNILTREYGLVPIGSLVDHDISVLTGNGSWVGTKVSSYGKQELLAVKIKYASNQSETIYATPDHDWIVGDSRVKTKDLKYGMKIPTVSYQRKENYEGVDYKFGVLHGLIYGDGVKNNKIQRNDSKLAVCKRDSGYMIRICSDHEDILKWFEDYSISYPPSYNGDPVVYMNDSFSQTHQLKELPSKEESDEYLIGFFRGWLAADGSNGGSGVTICVGDEEETWLREVMPKLGIFFGSSHYLPNTTNFGERKKQSKNLSIWSGTLTKEDFLIERKRDKWNGFSPDRTILSVEKTNRIEEVFCVEVPEQHNFVIERGILTGNCSYVAVNKASAFDEILYILLNGTGVGFSVESKDVAQLPLVAETFHYTDTTIVVADSKLGWAKAFKELIGMLYIGQIPLFDVSKVRPAGAPLKTFGGRASGPDPLISLFKFAIEIFKKAAGRKLTTLEAHDLVCKIADVVVVGGVRRAALISLSDLSDDRMRGAKSGQWWVQDGQRRLANNSAVYTEKPDIGIFMDEWKALYDSKSGERGIFNRQAAKRHLEKHGRRETDFDFGLNPCAEIFLRDKEFCVSGRTPLITKNGIFRIGDIENETHSIWNGEKWSEVIVRKTRENQNLVRVHLSDGSFLDCTHDHKFSVKNRFENSFRKVEAKNLTDEDYVLGCEDFVITDWAGTNRLDDPYTLGFAVGDGYVGDNKVYIDLYGEKNQCPVVGTRQKPYLPSEYNVEKIRVKTELNSSFVTALKNDSQVIWDLVKYDRNDVLDFVSGLADADGTQSSKGIRIYLSNEDRARALQLVLTYFGIKSSVNLFQKKGTITNLGTRNDDLWYLQITKTDELRTHRLVTENSSYPKFKGKYQTIKKIEFLSEKEDVFCFTEHEKHMGVFNNVLTYQCNLSEVVVRAGDSEADLLEKIRLATILGTWQSTLTSFKYISKKWKENCEEERLLGVSLTGIMDNVLTNKLGKALNERLEKFTATAVLENARLAGVLGIAPSRAVTCVKPSGTVSSLVDSGSGIHARHSPYYIRTVRADKKDPLAKMMVDIGFPVENDIMKPDSTYVFSFPIKAPSGAVVRSDLTAIDQLEIWYAYKTHYTEHNPSVTISVKESEWLKVGAWVYEHFDEMTGVSFLPYSEHSYVQSPYQECSEDEYKELLTRMPKNVDWSDLSKYETTDQTEGAQTLACTGATGCEL